MEFPKRIYTEEEVTLAKTLIEMGHQHRLQIIGSKEFRRKVREALKMIKKAGYYNFLRTYIRAIREIDGLSQLREAEASIWANKYTMENPIEAAGFIIQKAWQMRDYIEGEPYYGHIGETRAVRIRIKFLERLKERSKDPKIREECEMRLKLWDESVFL